jgi:uncharacterized protein YecT (DUF1311 family)
MKLVIIAILALSAGSIARAADCDGSTLEMLQCLAEKNSDQVGKITASTRQLLTILEARKKSGDGTPADYNQAKMNLTRANTTAAAALDLECKVESALETVTGSLGRLVYASCLLDGNTKRAQQLSELVAQSK